MPGGWDKMCGTGTLSDFMTEIMLFVANQIAKLVHFIYNWFSDKMLTLWHAFLA